MKLMLKHIYKIIYIFNFSPILFILRKYFDRKKIHFRVTCLVLIYRNLGLEFGVEVLSLSLDSMCKQPHTNENVHIHKTHGNQWRGWGFWVQN